MEPAARYEEAQNQNVLDGRYTLRRQIARGGQAAVFEAEHGVTRARVAVKVLLGSALELPEAHARLMREARILGALRHPNVVAIHDAGTCAKHGPYLVLEMIEGRPLDGILLTRQKLSVGQAIAIVVQLCDALTEVHRHGVVHRDVKPSNVLIASTRSGVDSRSGAASRSSDYVELIDFGVATSSAEEEEAGTGKLTRVNEIIGTVEYMAPEQLMGTSAITARSDVYSAGVVLYECLTGEVVHSGIPTAVMANMLSGARPAPVRSKRDDMPRQLEIVIAKALEIDPLKRYASTAELARACAASFAQPIPAIDLLDARDDRAPSTPPSAAADAPAPAQAETPAASDTASRRRQYVRAPYIAPVRVLMEKGAPSDGRIEDISEGGILVIMDGACGDDQRVRVRLVVPVAGRVVELEGTTKWIKTRRGQRAIGIEFVSLPDDVRKEIRAYVTLMTGGAQLAARIT